MTENRLVAIEASRELLLKLVDMDFSISKSGLKTTRIINKDIKQEIYIQIARNSSISIHANIYSKRIKNWHENKYNKNISGSIAFFQLGYLSPHKTWMTWEIGCSDIAKNKFIKDASVLIKSYLLPILDKFYNIDKLIDELCTNGGQWVNNETKYWIAPFFFILIYGGIKETQILFDNYIKYNESAKKNIAKYNLHTITYDPTNYISPFLGSEEIAIIFDNGILYNSNIK